MSYSDYGGYCWKNGARFQAAEDGTLVGVEAPAERPLEAATGFKLDVLVNAYAQQGSDYASSESHEKVDWLTGHPHHVVMGGMKGLAIAAHKQSATIVWDGKEVLRFPEPYDGPSRKYKDPYEKGHELFGSRDGWDFAARGATYPHSCGVLLFLRTPEGDVYSGVSGYGVGEHWWKDKEGYEHMQPGDRISFYPKALLRQRGRAPRCRSHIAKIFKKKIHKFVNWNELNPMDYTKEELRKIEKRFDLQWLNCSVAEEADVKKYGSPDADLGRKPMDPWPTEAYWTRRVQEWAASVVARWESLKAEGRMDKRLACP